MNSMNLPTREWKCAFFGQWLIAMALWILPTVGRADTQWITGDASPPGTPPTIELLAPDTPDADVTEYRLTVHGFYVVEVIEGGNLYQRIVIPSPSLNDVPGLEVDSESSPFLDGRHEIGRPELAFDAAAIGIATDAPGASINEVAPEVVDEYTSLLGAPIRIFPAQPDTEDCGCCGEQPFTIDQAFYDSSDEFYPAEDAVVGPIEGWMTLRTADVRLNLAKFRPSDGVLRIARQIRIRLLHPGNLLFGPNAPDNDSALDRVYAGTIRNYTKIRGFFNQLVQTRLLLIVHEDFRNAVEPLRLAKIAAGVQVERVTVIRVGPPGAGQITGTRAEVQAVISAFYNASRGLFVPYVLLVGDVDRIAPNTYTRGTGEAGRTDRPYSLVFGADKKPDLVISRISADTPEQCTQIVRKILRYENDPLVGNWPRRITLAAAQNGPHNYRANQCNVRNLAAAAAAAPNVSFAPGAAIAVGQPCASAGAGNNYIETLLNEGQGILGYRGHGCPDRWDGWSTLNQPTDSWRSDEVLSGDLQNGCANPIVFAMCCYNGKFDADPTPPDAGNTCVANNVADGIAEQWMQAGNYRGAVAHYGAVTRSFTVPNDDHNLDVFRAIYARGISRFGLVTMFAERENITKHARSGEDNVLVYELMGDPLLEIRTARVGNGGDGPIECCVGDLNGDGRIDLFDLARMLANFARPGALRYEDGDLNRDGTINLADLAIMLAVFGTECA